MSQRLKCPHCSTVLSFGRFRSASATEGTQRRRDCPRCGARYLTCETVVAVVRKPIEQRHVPAAGEARP